MRDLILQLGLNKQGSGRAFSPDNIAGLTQWLKADAGVYSSASAYFDGSNSRLNAGKALADPAAGDFYIAYWIYNISNVGGTNIYAAQGWDGTGGSNQFAVFIDNFAMIDSGGNLRYNTISALGTGAWFFCELVYSASGVFQYYVNNSLVSTLNYKMSVTPGFFNFGSAGGRRVNANYDCVGVWSRILSGAERTALYNGGAGLSYAGLSAGLKVGLTSYYNMDEKSGNRADSHGSNTLTLTLGSVGFAAGLANGLATNNSAVVFWDDQSANNYDAVQATLSKFPTYVTNSQNGLPAIIFDSSDDVLAATGINLAPPYTLYMACKPNNANGYLYDGTPFDAGGLSFSGGNARLSLASGFASTAYTQNTLALFTAIAGASSSSLQLNNNSAGTGGAGENLTGPWQIGGLSGISLSIGGAVYEVILYNTAHDAAQQAAVKSYLNTRWALF